MTDNPNAGMRTAWAKRSVNWLKRAPEAASPDDYYNQLVIGAAGIAPGDKVLDLASGTGEPAISIAQAVGDNGTVVACDFSPEMLSGARPRAHNLGLDQVQFAVADMETLPYPDGAFDALTCRFGLMFPSDRVRAASEARRVLRPSAKAAFVVWGPLQDNPLHEKIAATVCEFFGEPIPAKPPLRNVLGGDGALSDVLRAAGFADVTERAVRETRNVEADAAFWRDRILRNHFDRYQTLDENGQAALEDAVEGAFAPYRDGGTYRLMQHVKLGVGIAPG